MALSESIFRTIAYSDIFDFPLKEEEILRFLISPEIISRRQLHEGLLKDSRIEKKENFFFLKGRGKIVSLRKKRERVSEKKIDRARKIARLLSIIPSVRFIAVTGSLALKNAEEKDDIDFLVVTEKKKMWSTRFFLIALLKIIRAHRSRRSKNIKDKICLNMVIADTFKTFSEKKQNLFIAHEIIQMLPLFDPDKYLEKLINNNSWIKKYFGNVRIGKNKRSERKEKLLSIPLAFFDPLAKKIQKRMIDKNLTTETVEDNFLAFHPVDHQKEILLKFNKRLKNSFPPHTRGY